MSDYPVGTAFKGIDLAGRVASVWLVSRNGVKKWLYDVMEPWGKHVALGDARSLEEAKRLCMEYMECDVLFVEMGG